MQRAVHSVRYDVRGEDDTTMPQQAAIIGGALALGMR